MCKAAGVYIEKQLSVVRHNLAIHARIARPYIHSHLISLFLFSRTANNACMFEGPQQTPLALKHIYIQMHNAELSSFEATRIRFPQACELVFVAICCCWVAGTTETICSCPYKAFAKRAFHRCVLLTIRAAQPCQMPYQANISIIHCCVHMHMRISLDIYIIWQATALYIHVQCVECH